jgi:hypothetical protein
MHIHNVYAFKNGCNRRVAGRGSIESTEPAVV